MAKTEATSLSVEERLQRLEDQLAINQLMMTYGPCVDSGSADDTGRAVDS